jgi:outer membrane biosynthesis protein TonB
MKKEHALGLLVLGGLAYFLLAKKPEEAKVEEVKPEEVKPEEVKIPAEIQVVQPTPQVNVVQPTPEVTITPQQQVEVKTREEVIKEAEKAQETYYAIQSLAQQGVEWAKDWVAYQEAVEEDWRKRQEEYWRQIEEIKEETGYSDFLAMMKKAGVLGL